MSKKKRSVRKAAPAAPRKQRIEFVARPFAGIPREEDLVALAQVVPAGGRILDPFAGSGSTGVGALLEGRRFVGIEREAAYVDISRQRLQQAAQQAQEEMTA